MKLEFCNIDSKTREAMVEILPILGVEEGYGEIKVDIVPNNTGITITKKGNTVILGYKKRVEIFRGIGLLIENTNKDFHIEQVSKFDLLSVMFDNSRNAVLKTKTIKKFVVHMALMGFNSLMLYTEDTFEIKGYEYFGHMRGRFTSEELKELDEYTDLFGIEMIPCIQTLAHLNGIFRWPCFNDINDTADILMCDIPQTYELIDKMLETMSENIKSRRINIGCDEAHLVGLGKHLDKFGFENRFEIVIRHINKVLDLCKKYDYKPIMWSDMFFRLASPNGGYYNVQDKIPKWVIDKVNPEVDLCYWDYYHTSNDEYQKQIDLHKDFNNEIWFAGGAWKWEGFVPLLDFSIKTSIPALETCKKNNIRKIILTAWGDNGSECSNWTILPILQLYAENFYVNEISEIYLKERFNTCTNANWDAFMSLDLPNILPGKLRVGDSMSNNSKYLFYNDPLTGLLDKHLPEFENKNLYADYSDILRKNAAFVGEWGYVFETLADLCNVLDFKYDFGLRLKNYYDERNFVLLKEMYYEEIDEIIIRIETFHSSLRSQWMNENKSIGFDVLDLRIGGLIARFKSAKFILGELLSGKINIIEELESDRLPFDCNLKPERQINISANVWSRIVTANSI